MSPSCHPYVCAHLHPYVCAHLHSCAHVHTQKPTHRHTNTYMRAWALTASLTSHVYVLSPVVQLKTNREKQQTGSFILCGHIRKNKEV